MDRMRHLRPDATRSRGRAAGTVTILDARRAVRNPATQRKKQAEWIERHTEQLRKYSLGTAFIINSPLVRGVLTAILWVRPLPTQHTVVSTMEEAEAWVQQQLAAAGLAGDRRRP